MAVMGCQNVWEGIVFKQTENKAMLKIHNQHISLIIALLGILLANISTIVNADTLDRQVIATAGGYTTVGGYTLGDTLGQPFISTDSSSQLISGFWVRKKTRLQLIVDKQDIQVPEAGNETFNVSLSAKPSQNVSVTVKKISGDPDMIIQSGNTLTFSPDNWNTPQTVTVAAAKDEDVEEGTATLRVSASTSGNSISPIEIVLTEKDSEKVKEITWTVKEPIVDIKPGENFDLTIVFTPDSEKPADAIQIRWKFDPTKLKINEVTNSGVLDFELINEIGENFIDFAAVAFDNEVPTTAFELVTISMTALETATGLEETALEFVESESFVWHDNEILPQEFEDIIIHFVKEEPPVTECQVAWSGRPFPPREDSNWEAKLSLFTIDSVEPKEAEVDEEGNCVVKDTLVSEDYPICVKGPATLASKINDGLDFGTLWQGDINGDDIINPPDVAALAEWIVPEKYKRDFDFNRDGIIDREGEGSIIRDSLLKLIKEGDEIKLCERHEEAGSVYYRKGLRRGSHALVMTMNADIRVDSSFNLVIKMPASQEQPAEGAAVYLDFDPQRIKVNGIRASQHFDFVLAHEFDNTQGQVNFAAVAWDNLEVTEPFTVVTINFTLLGEGGEQTIKFSNTKYRKTMIVSHGESFTETDKIKLVAEDDGMNSANNTVSGRILDAFTNEPIANARVVIGELETVSNEFGEYEITGLPAGTHTVTVTSEDEHQFQAQTVTIDGEKPVILDFVSDWDEAFGCPIYAIQDHRVSDTQFFIISPSTKAVRDLGPLYKKHDIEGLAIDQATGTLYGTSGDKTDKQGHLYRIDRETGELTDIGPTGFIEVDSLAIRPNDGTLWGWAVGDGLITIDPKTGQGTLVVAYDKPFVEDMVWSYDGTTIYATQGHNLWAYDGEMLQLACDNLPGQVEGVEMLPGNALMFAFHQDNSARIHVLDIESCEVIMEEALDTPYKDIEGIAWWFGCTPQ